MTDPKDAGASPKAIDPVVLAKKHRIAVDDARKIILEYGDDRKSIDKAARRIAV